MKPSLIELLRCPECRSSLVTRDSNLECIGCGYSFPVIKSIPRFVPASNYAENFGLQWNLFRKTQLDSQSGVPISRNRFFQFTGWKPEELAGKRVLDVGCGAGRFAEIALECGAEVVAIDYSSAVEACWQNLKSHPLLSVLQADLYKLPFERGSFDFIYCLGVLQHTPDVHRAFSALPEYLKPDGKLAADFYPKLKRNLLWPKYWLRPFTKRMNPERLFKLVQRWTPLMLAASRVVGRVPIFGRQLRYFVPVANYEGVYPLTDRQLREWAVLDTFDMFSPAHDHPQSVNTVTQWVREAGLRDYEVIRSGFVVCRGVR